MGEESEKEPYERVARRLQLALERSGLTETEVADRIGVSQPSVHRWIKGDGRISLARIQQLANVLGVQIAWLVSEGEERQARLPPEVYDCWPLIEDEYRQVILNLMRLHARHKVA